MKKLTIKPEAGFEVLARTDRAEIATMVLDPGETTGGPDNKHDEGDQWMYVLSGSGQVEVGHETVDLAPGDFLLIERGETHEVRSTGEEPFSTLNFYAPKEY